jgi:serine protease Do
VGLLPKSEAYRAYLMQSRVAALLRGDRPHVMVDGGGLGPVGSVVFNADGKAIGFVDHQPGQTPLLNAGGLVQRVARPAYFFVPASDFVWSFGDLPQAGKPEPLPWLGVVQLSGLSKDVAEQYGLKDRPAVEVGDVIAGTPAQRAGLKPGDVIIAIDDQPVPRGDEPEDLPAIVNRLIVRKRVGQQVKLSVIRAPHEPPQELTVELIQEPRRPSEAQRYYAEDLGFSVREMLFGDRYVRRLEADAGGVVVAYIKPQSAANHAHLEGGDVIQWLNREPARDLAHFQRDYQRLREQHPTEPVVLVVLREGQTQTIRIEAPQ